MFGSFFTYIDRIDISDKYPYVRTIYFKDNLYRVVEASNKIYNVGDKVLYIPDRAKLPVRVLKALGFWDYGEDHGLLSGINYNVVRPYYFNNDNDYYSYGIIVPIHKLEEQGLSIDTTKSISIDQQLGITYLEKRNPYIFLGDEFLANIHINKNIAIDLERCFKQFEGKDIICEEYVRGRQFYVTFSLYSRNEEALGAYKSLYVTGQNYRPLRFLSNTKRNAHGNMFCRIASKNNLEDKLIAVLRQYRGYSTVTFNVVVRTQAFGNTHEKDLNSNKYVITDIAIGGDKQQHFLTTEERNNICNAMGIPAPEYLYSGPFHYETLYRMANIGSSPHHINHVGIIVRDNATDTRAVLYSEAARFRYIFNVKN